MQNYPSALEKITSLKKNSTLKRTFQVEHNEYHHNRIQPTDIDIILDVIQAEKLSKFDFAAELYCRTLLAQIINFKYSEHFNNDGYDEPNNINRYQFIETIGWCPSRCQRHIRPIILPLLILYWNPNEKYDFNGSDNPSVEEAKKTLEKYSNRFEQFKAEFVKRIPTLFEYILNPKAPNETKSEIINDFTNFAIEINDEY